MSQVNIGIMQLPSGIRVSINTEVVSVGNGVFEYNVTYTAVPTNSYKYIYGAWRRLFIEADREFYPGERSIWLSASPDDYPNKQMEASDGLRQGQGKSETTRDNRPSASEVDSESAPARLS